MKSALRRQRIGIFGGTFDPPHLAHLIIADQALHQLELDKVIFVPAYLPPHKEKGAEGTPSQRYAMLEKAISGCREFDVTSIEIDRKGVSYTIDTLRHIKTKFRNANLFLIVGGDNYRQLENWKSANEIRKLVTFVVYNRANSPIAMGRRQQRRVVPLKGAQLDISSTMIRYRVNRGESIRFLVPASVELFIRRHKLYL